MHRVAVLGLAGLAEIDLEKLGTERLHLFRDHRAGIECHDPGAEPLGRGDCLKSRDAGTDHEHVGRFQRARRGHHHRHDPRHARRGEQHHHVTGEVGLGTQCIHLLRARGAWNHLHADRRHAGGAEGLDQRRFIERIEITHVDAAALEQRDILGRGLVQPQHQVRARQHFDAIADDARTGRHEVLVAESGAAAEAGFDDDVGAGARQLLDHRRYHRGAMLAGLLLPRNPYQHAVFLCLFYCLRTAGALRNATGCPGTAGDYSRGDAVNHPGILMIIMKGTNGGRQTGLLLHGGSMPNGRSATASSPNSATVSITQASSVGQNPMLVMSQFTATGRWLRAASGCRHRGPS